MKRFLAIVVLGLVVQVATLGVATQSGCTPGERQLAKTALDVTQQECLRVHQEMPDEKAGEICGIANPLLDVVRIFLSGARLERAAMRDAGVSMSPDASASFDGGSKK